MRQKAGEEPGNEATRTYVILCARANRRGVYSRAAFISLNCVASIHGNTAITAAGK